MIGSLRGVLLDRSIRRDGAGEVLVETHDETSAHLQVRVDPAGASRFAEFISELA